MTRDDWMSKLLTACYVRGYSTFDPNDEDLTIEKIASVLRSEKDPWMFKANSGLEGMAAITVLTEPHNEETLYVNVRTYTGENLQSFRHFFVSIEYYGWDVTIKNTNLPMSWCSPTTRKFEGVRGSENEGIEFFDLLDDCSKEKSWYISPLDAEADQIDYFTLNRKSPNDSLLLLTQARFLRSEMLVVRATGRTAVSHSYDLNCQIGGNRKVVVQSEPMLSSEDGALYFPIDLFEQVPMEEIFSVDVIYVSCPELNINAEFPVSGLYESQKYVLKQIPPFTTKPVW